MMKKFQSRFDQILRFREQLDRMARADVRVRSSDLEELLIDEQHQRDALLTLQQAAADQLRAGISGCMLATLQNAVFAQEACLKAVDEQRQKAEAALDAALQVLQMAHRELHIVTQAVSHEKISHRRNELRRQDQQMFEQAAQTWYQRNPADARARKQS